MEQIYSLIDFLIYYSECLKYQAYCKQNWMKVNCRKICGICKIRKNKHKKHKRKKSKRRKKKMKTEDEKSGESSMHFILNLYFYSRQEKT